MNAVFTCLRDALASGDRIELRGFGSFLVRPRAAHERRNPRTGARVTVAAKNIAVFKVSKDLRARVGGTSRSASAAPPTAALVDTERQRTADSA